MGDFGFSTENVLASGAKIKHWMPGSLKPTERKEQVK
jgi:hypothetical protein